MNKANHSLIQSAGIVKLAKRSLNKGLFKKINKLAGHIFGCLTVRVTNF